MLEGLANVQRDQDRLEKWADWNKDKVLHFKWGQELTTWKAGNYLKVLLSERCQQQSLAVRTTSHILAQTTGQHIQQGQENYLFPPFCTCKIASGAFCPLWGSPVQEGYTHTALNPMDSCQDGQRGSHTSKDGRGDFRFEKSRKKNGPYCVQQPINQSILRICSQTLS